MAESDFVHVEIQNLAGCSVCCDGGASSKLAEGRTRMRRRHGDESVPAEGAWVEMFRERRCMFSVRDSVNVVQCNFRGNSWQMQAHEMTC